MGCGPEVAGSVYHPRQPQQAPSSGSIYPQFEAVYEERYQQRYGFWRPIIATVVRKFLECGDLKHGVARVRCPKCREEFFVPYSCRVRCFCPSCHEMKTLLTFVPLITAAFALSVFGPAQAQSADAKIRVMLLTGQCNQYHN